MIQFHFDFQGSGLFFSFLLLSGSLLALVSLRISDKSFQGVWRYGLLGIRTLAFILLLFLFFDPEFSGELLRQQERRTGLIIDDSRSMSTAWASGELSLPKALQTIQERLRGRTELDLYTSSGKALGRLSQLDFSEPFTELRAPVSDQRLEEYHSFFLVSDGYFNSGAAPADQPWVQNIPVYPILPLPGVNSQSLEIVRLATGPRPQAGQDIPVRIHLRQIGLTGTWVDATVHWKGSLIGTGSAKLDHAVVTLRIPVKFEHSGHQPLKIQVQDRSGEFAVEKSLDLDVEPDRTGVWILSESLSPLVKFLARSFPDTVYATELFTATHPDGLPAVPTGEQDPDLVVLVDAERFLGETAWGARLTDLFRDPIALIIFNTRGQVPASQLLTNFEITSREMTGSQTQLTVFEGQDYRSSPIRLEYLSQTGDHRDPDWLALPPLQRPPRIWSSAGMTTLLTASSGTEQIPLLGVDAEHSLAILNGEGVWRWFLRPPGDQQFSVFWRELVAAILRIREFRPVQLQVDAAQVYEGVPVPGTVQVRNFKGQSLHDVQPRVFTMGGDGDGGERTIPVHRENSGVFRFEFTPGRSREVTLISEVRRAGEPWGADTLSLPVSSFDPELQSRGIDRMALAALAGPGGGKILDLAELDDLELPGGSYLEHRSWDFAGTKQARYLLILITLLALEWIWRRRRGLL